MLIGGDPWYNVIFSHGNNEYLSDFDYYASKVLSGIDFRAKNIDVIRKFRKKFN